MPWTNGPLVLYHGCDHISADSIMTPVLPNQHGIHLTQSRALTDFGRGFYTTTSLHQAKNWANSRCRRQIHTASSWLATVLSFRVDRNRLAAGNREQMEWVRFYEREGFSRPSGFAVPPGRVPGT